MRRKLAWLGFTLLALALAAAVIRSLCGSPPLPGWQIGALAVGFGLGVWELRYGIVALVFLIPLLGVIPRSLGISDLSLAEHMLIPLLVCGSVRMAWTRAPRAVSAIERPLAVFTAIVAVSAAGALWEYCAVGPSLWEIVGSQVNQHFAFTIGDYTQGPFLVVHYTLVALEGALWFALLTAPGSGVRAASLRWALLLSATVVGLVGVAQSIWHFQMVEFFERVQPGLTRINSTLPDPNTLGSFLVLLFPLGLAVALERPAGTWLAVGWSGLILYCLGRSVSRAAWVGLAGAASAAVVLAAWRPSVLGVEIAAPAARHLRHAVVALLVGAVLVVAVVSVAGIGRNIVYGGARSPVEMLLFTLNLRRPLDELVPARFDHWHAAINIWRDFPLLGAGIGKYALLKNRYLPEARSHWMFFTEPHNYFLKVLSELGIVGLAAFLVLLGSIGVQARRAWAATDGHGRRRIAAVVAGLVGFLLCSLAQDPLTLREMQYVFWSVVALLVLEMKGNSRSK